MGKRRLGVDIRDDYGRLIPPAEGELGVLRQGGDDFSVGVVDIPQRTVALFTGAVRAAPDGTATVTLDIPDFAGELRLMAVAWDGEGRTGAASRPLTVRDPVVAEALLPRFLAPGDEARLPVLLHNLDLPQWRDHRDADGRGRDRARRPRAACRDAGAQCARAADHHAARDRGGGGGAAPRRHRARRLPARRARAASPSAPPAPLRPRSRGRRSRPARTAPLAFAPDRWIAGTWRAAASFGGPTRFDAAGMLRMLDALRLRLPGAVVVASCWPSPRRRCPTTRPTSAPAGCSRRWSAC